MPVHLAQLQHFDHVMHIFRATEQISNSFAIHTLYAVFKCLGTLSMLSGNRWVFLQTLNSLKDLVRRVL